MEPSQLSQWFHGKYENPDPKNKSPILLLDGGVSTHLEHLIQKQRRRGRGVVGGEGNGPVFAHRELWSSSLLLTQEGRDLIKDCHEDFFRAGANIAETVTYQAHYLPLVRKHPEKSSSGSENDETVTPKLVLSEGVVDSMLRDGVRLAKAAARNILAEKKDRKGPMYVAASIGCYGGALADGSEYTGNYGLTIAQLISFHERKASILVSESPDVLAFETVPCVIECQAILEVLKKLHADRGSLCPPAWMSLACCDGTHLNDGSDIVDALQAIDILDPCAQLVQAIGINCCACEHVHSLITLIGQHVTRTGVRRAIILYPNSGEEWDAARETWVENTGITTPEQFADAIVSYVDSLCEQHGTDEIVQVPLIVGGCCRTSPETIAAIRRKLC